MSELNRKQAKQMAKDLKNSGYDYAEIQKVLADKYISNHTGKPIGVSGVVSLINSSRWPSHKKPHRKTRTNGNGSGKISQAKASRQDGILTAVKLIRELDIGSDDKEAITDILLGLL